MLLSIFCFAAVARAQDGPGGGKKASVELLVPKKTVKPGETLQIGVKFTMQPGWHIYWTNPGDSGQPPRFHFNPPGGGAGMMMRGSEWKVGDVAFPTPVRWVGEGGIVGYGYTGTVVFPATVTVPASATPGQGADLGLSVEYLICKDVCIPETAGTSVNLTVGLDAGEEPDADDKAAAKEIEQANKRLPAAAGKPTPVANEGGQCTMRASVPAGAKNVAFFPDAPSGVAVEDVKLEQKGPQTTITFRLRTLEGINVSATSFPAVVGYDAPGGERRGLTLTVPLAEQKPTRP